jgi:DNA primase
MIKEFSIFALHSEREILEGLKHYDLKTLKSSGLVNDYGNIVFKSHTLIIPYFVGSEIFTFQGRTIEKNIQKTPKYLFLKGAKSGQMFFNINELLHPKKENIVICEGVFDALTMCQYLRENNEKNTAVIACLGVNNFPLNSIPLFKAFKTITLCFDNDFEKSDNVGQNKTLKLVNDFAKEGITVQAKQTPPPYKDFSEMYSKLLCKQPPPQKKNETVFHENTFISENLEKMVNINPNLGTLISKFNCKEF